jgi:hypothetical protein
MNNQLTKFPLFSSLPSELRFRIWKYALPDPRVVVFSFPKKIPDVMRDYAAEPQDPSDEEEDKDGDDDDGETTKMRKTTSMKKKTSGSGPHRSPLPHITNAHGEP